MNTHTTSRLRGVLALTLIGPLGLVGGCTFEVTPTVDATERTPAVATLAPDLAVGAAPEPGVPDRVEEPVAPGSTPGEGGAREGVAAEDPVAGAVAAEPERPVAAQEATPVVSDDTPAAPLVPTVSLVAGSDHACALSETGAVSCWGRNDDGQLGYGHTEAVGDDELPGSYGIVEVGDAVVSLAAGARHTCAILEKGSIRCWGHGGDLALGNGNGKYYTVGDDETPAQVGDAIVYSNSPFVQLAAGDHHTCVRLASGAVKCWGDAPDGALGYGWATKTGGWLGNVPMGDSATAVVAGADHTCALVQSGLLRCWGHAAALGYGAVENLGDDDQPSMHAAVALGAAVTQLAAGDRHTCALTAAGSVHCWGLGSLGVLGYGQTDDVAHATSAGLLNLGGLAVQIAAGRDHTCAVMLDGAVRCWGSGAEGALGYGTTEDIGDDEVPAAAGTVELDEPAIEVVAGAGFSCALLHSGFVRCWGSGLDGRLGTGRTESVGDDETPASAGDPLAAFGW